MIMMRNDSTNASFSNCKDVSGRYMARAQERVICATCDLALDFGCHCVHVAVCMRVSVLCSVAEFKL